MEEAIQQLSNLILPFTDPASFSRGGYSHTLASVRPLLILMAANLVSLFLLSVALKLSLAIFNLLVTGLNKGLKHAHRFARRLLNKHKGRAHQRANGAKGSRTHVFEEEAHETNADHDWCGKDWTRQEASDTSTNEGLDALREAFTTLGLKPSASEDEIRAAYRRLIKRYHPDLYMKASPAEQARVNHIIVKVRHAYDILTREGTNLH